MHLFSKKFLVVLSMTLLSASSVSAFCPRCAAIEGQRAEDQAKHPTKEGYYDDNYPVHQQTQQGSGQNVNSQKVK